MNQALTDSCRSFLFLQKIKAEVAKTMGSMTCESLSLCFYRVIKYQRPGSNPIVADDEVPKWLYGQYN